MMRGRVPGRTTLVSANKTTSCCNIPPEHHDATKPISQSDSDAAKGQTSETPKECLSSDKGAAEVKPQVTKSSISTPTCDLDFNFSNTNIQIRAGNRLLRIYQFKIQEFELLRPKVEDATKDEKERKTIRVQEPLLFPRLRSLAPRSLLKLQRGARPSGFERGSRVAIGEAPLVLAAGGKPDTAITAPSASREPGRILSASNETLLASKGILASVETNPLLKPRTGDVKFAVTKSPLGINNIQTSFATKNPAAASPKPYVGVASWGGKPLPFTSPSSVESKGSSSRSDLASTRQPSRIRLIPGLCLERSGLGRGALRWAMIGRTQPVLRERKK